MKSTESPETCEQIEDDLKDVCNTEEEDGKLISASDPSWLTFGGFYGNIVKSMSHFIDERNFDAPSCSKLFDDYTNKCVGVTAAFTKAWHDRVPGGIPESILSYFVYDLLREWCEDIAEAPAAPAPAAQAPAQQLDMQDRDLICKVLPQGTSQHERKQHLEKLRLLVQKYNIAGAANKNFYQTRAKLKTHFNLPRNC